MYLKSINNLNMKAIPMFSDACNNYNSWKSIINESLPDKINENELVISCVQEIYGYRTGVFGYVFNYLSLKCKLKTTFIVDYLNKYYFMNNNLMCWDSLFLHILNQSPIRLLGSTGNKEVENQELQSALSLLLTLPLLHFRVHRKI